MPNCKNFKHDGGEEYFYEHSNEIQETVENLGYVFNGYTYEDNGYVYLKVCPGMKEEVTFNEPEWTEISDDDLFYECGNHHPFIEGYTPSGYIPEPTPPKDPTVSELADLIVETSVNVDYLVSLQSFQ